MALVKLVAQETKILRTGVVGAIFSGVLGVPQDTVATVSVNVLYQALSRDVLEFAENSKV